jgi:hypothetical protein
MFVPPEDASGPGMRRRYVLVLVVEVIVLAALWALPRVFA